MKESAWFVVVVALLTVLAPVVAGLDVASAPKSVDSIQEDEGLAGAEEVGLPPECGGRDFHPPIRNEDEGDFTWEWTNPATGEREYRPGSGVRSGNGTEGNPYIISGWCFVGTQYGHPDTNPNEYDPEEDGLDGATGRVDHYLWDARVKACFAQTVAGIYGSAHWNHFYHEDSYMLKPHEAIQLHERSTQAHVVIEDVVITGFCNGIRLSSKSNVTVRDSVFVNNRGSAIHLLAGGSGPHDDTRSNPISDPRSAGVPEEPLEDHRPMTNVSITRNTFNGGGIAQTLRHTDHTVIISDNVLSGGGKIRADGEGVRIVGNTVSNGFRSGITIGPLAEDMVVEGNTILDSVQYGIEIWGPQNAILNNTIHGSGEAGVKAHEPSILNPDGVQATVRGNNIHDTVSGVGVDAEAPAAFLDARENWWGCSGGPGEDACDGVEGAVWFDPWLTEPNPDAGAK